MRSGLLFISALAVSFVSFVELAQADQSIGIDQAFVDACLQDAKLGARSAESCIGLGAMQCILLPDAYSTVGMARCHAAEYRYWEKNLINITHQLKHSIIETDQELKALGSASAPVLPFFEASEDNWENYREAQCAYNGSEFRGGTGSGPAHQICMAELTAKRFIELSKQLPEEVDQ